MRLTIARASPPRYPARWQSIRGAFGADPLVHALFAAPGDIGDMLARSRELRAFLANPAQSDGDEFFALLGTDGDRERRQELEARQRQAIASLEPARLLDALADWLVAPEKRLYLKPGVVTVDRMGAMATHSAPRDNVSTLSIPELVARDRRHWIVLVARFRRADAQEALRRQHQANRYLVI